MRAPRCRDPPVIRSRIAEARPDADRVEQGLRFLGVDRRGGSREQRFEPGSVVVPLGQEIGGGHVGAGVDLRLEAPQVILAIGAHPDDIEFGCAHLLIKEVKKGNQVKILVLTKGEAGTGNIVEAVRHLRSILGDIRKITQARTAVCATSISDSDELRASSSMALR